MGKYANCLKSYEVFEQFMRLCLIEDRSLIWPDKEVWTLDNLQKIKTHFVDNPLLGGDFWTKLFDQFSDLNEGCWRILGDAFLVYTLPSTYMKPERKYGYIKKVCDKKQLNLPDFSDERWDVLNQGFTRTSMQYHQKYKQLWVIFLFAIRVKRKKDRNQFLEDHKAVRSELFDILEGIDSKGDRSYGMLNAILHLGYPEHYERMISKTDKEKVVNYYNSRIDAELRTNGNTDEKILSIRKSFENDEYKQKDFDFYLPSVQENWREVDGKQANKKPTDIEAEDVVEEDPLLDDLVRSLRRHKQLILYGPPGTGKTYYAQKLAKTVIAQDNFEKDFSQLDKEEKEQLKVGPITDKVKEEESTYNYKSNLKYLRFCTFHPAYGYENFIEGYRPEITEDGRPTFKLKDGIFKNICTDAKDNPDKTFVLIIDEINRGDIPRIFGELITLIETEKRWKLENINPETAVILPASSKVFAVPENVLLIGTMNTADQSIALLDIALRRRFGFRELMPMTDLLENQDISGVNLGKWLKELNERILQKAGRNLQIGHSYLMKNGKPIKNEEQLIACVKDEILPLLQEYCYDDYSTLEDILGSKIVNVQKGGFNQQIFSSSGNKLIINSMKELVPGDEDVE
ncbi:MAG: McrB family protein [Halanaerobiales bacterium]